MEPVAFMELLVPIAGGFIFAGLNDAAVEKVMRRRKK
jgi:hypothetical protein